LALIKKILVPYDGSKYSDMSLSQAREIAEKFDATIFLLMVIDEHELSHGMLRASLEADYKVADTFRKFIKSEVIKAKKIIAKKATTCEKKGIKVHHHAMKGEPTEAILDYAIANKINLKFTFCLLKR